MAYVVTIDKQVQWNNGRTSVIYYIENDTTGEIRLADGGILDVSIDPQTYGDSNASRLFLNGETIDQLSKSEVARKQISESVTLGKRDWDVIKKFDDVLERRFKAQTMTLEGVYADWRVIYDSLPTAMKTQIIGYTSVFTVSFDFTEPKAMTDIYRAEFNRHIRNFLEYIIDRALI